MVRIRLQDLRSNLLNGTADDHVTSDDLATFLDDWQRIETDFPADPGAANGTGASGDNSAGDADSDFPSPNEAYTDPSGDDNQSPPMGGGGAAAAGDDMGDGNGDTSPLVVDLTGNGLNLNALSYFSPYFDLTANGFAHKSGWIGTGTGLLCLDGNGDGQINTGLELFGTAGGAPDGFAALGALDSNSDGVIDASDAAFSQLRVWVNPERHGIVHSGELLTLSQLDRQHQPARHRLDRGHSRQRSTPG